MKNFFILLSVLGISIPLWSEKLEAASVDKSVIRVNTTMQSYNLIQPWEKGASSTRIGLGAVLPEGKVLVTAQMVTDATYIELEKPDTAAKATAKVITVDYEANLALLEPINDNDFLSDRLPFELDTKLSPKDKVEAWICKNLAVSMKDWRTSPFETVI